MSDFYPGASEEPDRIDLQVARLETEHISLAQLMFVTRDEVRAMNKLLTAVMEGLQKPGRGMNDGLLEAISRIMTRVRGTEEAYTELRNFVVESHANVAKVLETSQELAENTRQIIALMRKPGGKE
jgi:hypothetical protein